MDICAPKGVELINRGILSRARDHAHCELRHAWDRVETEYAEIDSADSNVGHNKELKNHETHLEFLSSHHIHVHECNLFRTE